MKIFTRMKDGGPESRVWGYWLIEAKKLFSVVLLHFKDGSREAYHSHAFNAISWVLRGKLSEERLLAHGPNFIRSSYMIYEPSFKPIWTPRDNMHRVHSQGNTWAISFRGPWAKYWQEYIMTEDRTVTLTDGRVEVPDVLPITVD
jgi:hypothetical protein